MGSLNSWPKCNENQLVYYIINKVKMQGEVLPTYIWTTWGVKDSAYRLCANDILYVICICILFFSTVLITMYFQVSVPVLTSTLVPGINYFVITRPLVLFIRYRFGRGVVAVVIWSKHIIRIIVFPVIEPWVPIFWMVSSDISSACCLSCSFFCSSYKLYPTYH